MWETRSVELSVQLPREIADLAEERQADDPEFMSRVILYGLTRRSIYRPLRQKESSLAEVDLQVGPPSL